MTAFLLFEGRHFALCEVCEERKPGNVSGKTAAIPGLGRRHRRRIGGMERVRGAQRRRMTRWSAFSRDRAAAS